MLEGVDVCVYVQVCGMRDRERFHPVNHHNTSYSALNSLYYKIVPN